MIRFRGLIKLNNNIRNFYTSNIIRNKIYTDNEEWISNCKKYKKIGLTYNAIDQIGELVFVEYLNSPGDIIHKGDELVIIESVKSSNSIDSPFNCEIIDNNEKLCDDFDIINKDPECIDESWFVKIKEIT
jgi:glycine cleavage system H protein